MNRSALSRGMKTSPIRFCNRTDETTTHLGATVAMQRFFVCAAMAACLMSTVGADAASGVAPLDALHSPFVGGNAAPPLPAGKQGGIALVKIGKCGGSSVPFVIRNNTPQAVERVGVTVVVLNKKGRVLKRATAPKSAAPFHVESGEIAFANLPPTVSCPSLPRGSRLKLTATWQPAKGVESDRVDLAVGATTMTGSGTTQTVTGSATNQSNVFINPMVWTRVYCFSSTGALLYQGLDGHDEGVSEAGGSITFRADFPNGAPLPCPVYLVTVSGGGG